ncbi:MAG: bifunctional UDP-N-acetylglucosamine diphosphorylase/glucosamine-1-phosphate N-acetyltransferase GlmU [Anaerolineales bacterium]|nr:bifunctional UDP-N-acetylglucosamine diphosphorylase/glucosamine-1-phosphate N-acetyltransferase GlmU [Anaerolineales bacterium]
MICTSVILGAGHGKRMQSELPKVLHSIAGLPLIEWALRVGSEACGRKPVVVVGPDAKQVREMVGDRAVLVEQSERLGTGHAVQQAESVLQGKSDLVLVTYADMPLLSADTLRGLIELQEQEQAALSMLTVLAEDPRGFGRILRDANNQVAAIVEEADATLEQKKIRELNPGVYCFQADWLWDHLPLLKRSVSGEFYLTDLIAVAVAEGRKVAAFIAESRDELIGVNTRVHLAEAEKAIRIRINTHWMHSGVTMIDPERTYIGADVTIGKDTILAPGCVLEGNTVIGEHTKLGPDTFVRDSHIGNRCEIRYSVIEHAILEDDVDVGPFGHLRKGAHLKQGVHMGNFGEVKNSTLESGVKMGHFSYIGDAEIHEDVNIGAGTVTCNFDGKHKHKTEVGAGAFIGSGTMLVAPIRLGQKSVTGAGSVVTREVAENSVVVGVPAREMKKKSD